MKPVPVVRYSDCYVEQKPSDPLQFIRQYPTDLIILRLSHICAILFNEPLHSTTTQKKIFETCFSLLDKEKVDSISQQLFKDGKDWGSEMCFFAAPAISYLVKECLNNFHSPDSPQEHLNSSHFENDLFDNILLQNDNFYSVLDKDGMESHKAIWQLQLMQQGYIRDQHNLFMISPLKSLLFRKFIALYFPDGQALLGEFSANLGIDGFHRYFFHFADILQAVTNTYAKEGNAKYIITPLESQKKIINLFSLSAKDFLNKDDIGNVHRDIIPKPFYMALGEHPVVIDFHFFVHIMDIALPYNFYAFTSLKSRFSNFTAFKAELGKHYYEGFILGQTLAHIYNGKNFSLFQSKDNSPLPDFTIVRNQKEVIMIEVKGSAVHHNTLENLNVTEFEQFLNHNFATEKGESKRNKGIYQLTQQISDLWFTSKLDFLTKQKIKKEKLTIFPIIVYTDSTLDMAGVNTYLNSKFIAKLSGIGVGFHHIHPLTLVNINFFIEHYYKLRKNPKFLIERVRSYWGRVSGLERQYRRRPNPYTFFEKSMSFEQYIDAIHNEDDFSQTLKLLNDDLKLDNE